MSTRRWILILWLATCGWLATQAVAPSLAQQKTEPGQSADAAAAAQENELNLRYAQAHLRPMQARLAELDERNRRAPNTIRPAAIQLARQYVDKARQRLESARGDGDNSAAAPVLRAETELRLAEENLRESEAVNKRLPNTVSPGEIARLVAQRDLARIKVEKSRRVSSLEPLARIRFELDQLREDIEELQLRETMARRGS
jgi:hypothetical protein